MDLAVWKQDIYDHYMDAALQVTVDRGAPDNSTGNGLLHLGLFVSIIGVGGAITYRESDTYDRAINLAMVQNRDGSQIKGLFSRSFWKLGEAQSWDDYIGICAGSFWTNHPAARWVYEYGKKNNWSFDNLNPYKFSWRKWFGRFIGFPQFVKMCSGKKTNVLENLMIALKIVFTDISASDSCMKTYIIITVARDCSLLSEWASRLTLARIRRKYHSVGLSFAPYFQSVDHPLTLEDWR